MNLSIIKITILLLLLSPEVFSQQLMHRDEKLMGVDFQFSIFTSTTEHAEQLFEGAIREARMVEQMISSWDPNSETSKINNNSGIKPVKVSRELFQLIERSIRISKLTNGAFDISCTSLSEVWYFDKPMQKLPSEVVIKNILQNVNYKKIHLNKEESTVFLENKGMKIGFGAIGKGYVAEKIKKYLINKGVTSGLVNASGDIICWGDHPKTKKWKVAIKNPNRSKAAIAWFDLYNSGVVTSGNYENFIEIDGIRYSHILDPKTGWPSRGIQSVTVFSDNAELADALSTSVFVLGVKKGLNLINQLKSIECILVDDKGRIHYSNQLNVQ